MAHDYNNEITRIAKKIKTLRLAKGLTAQELAYRCNMERSNVSRLEAGNANPTLRTLLAIAHALDVPLSELFW